MTPLHVAAEKGGRSNIMELLIISKADINAKDNDEVSIWNQKISIADTFPGSREEILPSECLRKFFKLINKGLSML